MFEDELWICPVLYRGSSRKLFSDFLQMQNINKLVIYPFLSDFVNRKPREQRWFAIAIDKKWAPDSVYDSKITKIPEGIITFSLLRNNDDSIFIKALSDELSSLTMEEMEEYAVAKRIYKPKWKDYIEAQADTSAYRYGRVRSYNVMGIYFKPYPSKVFEQLLKNKE